VYDEYRPVLVNQINNLQVPPVSRLPANQVFVVTRPRRIPRPRMLNDILGLGASNAVFGYMVDVPGNPPEFHA
jgi:hypothetical protein